MRPYLLFSFLLLGLVGCQDDNSVKNPKNNLDTVNFVCESTSDDEALPASNLFVVVGDSKIKLTNIPICSEISKVDYAKYDIPPTAVAAAGGYFAGLGEYFYAVREGDQINIISGYQEEMQEKEGFHYDRMASVRGSKITFSGMEEKTDLTGWYVLGGHDNSYFLFLGMQDDTLQAKYAEIEGMLPPRNEIHKYMTGLAMQPIAFEVDMDNLSFESALGRGYFERIPTHVLITFEEKKDPVTGASLTLNKEQWGSEFE